jgi:hypothetical protein
MDSPPYVEGDRVVILTDTMQVPRTVVTEIPDVTTDAFGRTIVSGEYCCYKKSF